MLGDVLADSGIEGGEVLRGEAADSTRMELTNELSSLINDTHYTSILLLHKSEGNQHRVCRLDSVDSLVFVAHLGEGRCSNLGERSLSDLTVEELEHVTLRADSSGRDLTADSLFFILDDLFVKDDRAVHTLCEQVQQERGRVV